MGSVKYVAPLIRPNLLDNWYFVGGGSQQGGGLFPINQRGQTSYIGQVWGVDRWKNHQSIVTVALDSDGLSISRSSGDFYSITQYIENVSDLLGKKVTISFLYSGNTVSPYRIRARLVANGNVIVATTDDSGGGYQGGLIWGSGVVPADTTSLFVSIYTSTTAICKAHAIKLELGSTQTLCHNEGTEANPVWVLNEIPNFQQELAKCQRYAQIIKVGSSSNVVGFGYAKDSTLIRVGVPTPISMRSVPTVSFLTGSLSNLHLHGNGSAITPTEVSARLCDNVVTLDFTVSGATANNAYVLRPQNATMLLSADFE